MSDDTPTRKFEAQPPEGAQAPAVDPKPRPPWLVPAVIGGALLVAVIILLIILLTRGTGATTSTPSPTPTASATPTATATPTASASATPEPAQTTEPAPVSSARFSSFTAPSEEGGCSTGGPDFGPTRPLVKVSWVTEGAVQAWFVTGDSDAADSRFMQIPLTGNQNTFAFPVEFQCNADSVTYTITLVGPDGQHVNKRWTVKNTGDKF